MADFLDRAADLGAGPMDFPEIALTTFSPRWFIDGRAEVDASFETAIPNAPTAPLFERARVRGVGITFGDADLTPEVRPLDTSILTDRRSPELYRGLGLQRVEHVTIGYNTQSPDPQAADE